MKYTTSVFTKIQRNPKLTAKAAGLQYVSTESEGWYRKKKGKNFYYLNQQGEKCSDPTVLQRIKKLAIPPAWEQVWICADENGHLQATGLDQKKRKQYRYHPAWNQLRSQTKYFRLPQFAEALPLIRMQLAKDLAKPGFSYEKILALAVSIIQLTNIRVGNEAYKKLYGSFGLTTLQNRHVKVEGTEIVFQFKGKKGIYHKLHIKSRKLARLIQKCKELPGRELFQYIDANGNQHSIGSGDVNAYLKTISGMDFTAKDFRTWAGTLIAYQTLKKLPPPETETETKRAVLHAIDTVAEQLGNTRNVCKKYYIHPAVIEAYENKKMLHVEPSTPSDTASEFLSDEELELQRLLLNYSWDAVA